MSEHTQEPWRVVADFRIHSSGAVIGVCGDPPQRDYVDGTVERWAADASRIVMCVNAMQGMRDMRPGDVKMMVEALTELIYTAEYWINTAGKPGMSEQEYRTWLTLGHQSKGMRLAKKALQELEGEK